MPERPAPVNDPASVPQVLQPLQGSVEQNAPPATSSSQADATSGTSASANNASQSSSQENATESNVSNNSTVALVVFSYNALVLYSRSFPKLHFLGYVFFFPVTREPAVLRLRDGSTWSVIYSVVLARIQFLLMLGDNQLFYIMFCCCSRLFSFLCLFLMN